ncbi:MAG: hypothetical protein WCC17_00275 [Candidatus Nitrosopolaris sp.]
MNKLTGFAILVFAALLLIVSSSFAKVTAQGNDSSSEKSTTAKTCSPELFKEKPGLCAAIYALAHNKEGSASAEKPAAEKPSETGTIITAPIEVKKGPTVEDKKANAVECPAGQAKDWAGICYPLKECKASISAQPGTCTQSEEEKTTGMLTGELQIKKPATSSNPVSENCLKTETKSGELLCLTKGTLAPASTPTKEAEKPVPELNCNKPAGTKNGIPSTYGNGPFYEPC